MSSTAKRSTERQATFLRAKATGIGSECRFECLIVDISEMGARLFVDVGIRVPNEFILTVPARRSSYHCKKVRRAGDHVGVQFV